MMNWFNKLFGTATPPPTTNREQENRDRATGAITCHCGQYPIVIRKNDKVYEIGCVAHTTRQETFRAPTVEKVIELWNGAVRSA